MQILTGLAVLCAFFLGRHEKKKYYLLAELLLFGKYFVILVILFTFVKNFIG